MFLTSARNKEILSRVSSMIGKQELGHKPIPINFQNTDVFKKVDDIKQQTAQIIENSGSQLQSLELYTDRINKLRKIQYRQQYYQQVNNRKTERTNSLRKTSANAQKSQLNNSFSQKENLISIKNNLSQEKPSEPIKKRQPLAVIPFEKKEKYSIICNLGKGRFADVFIGQDQETKEQVALKIIQKSLIKRHQIEQLITQEIKILKKTDHRYVVKLYSVMEDDQKIMMAFELCDQNLRKIIEQNLPYDKLIELLYQIVKGLYYIHEKSIIHRDLKPDNILISKGQIKLADFGIAKEFSGLKYGLVEIKGYYGTPGYMSPEIIENKSYGLKSDVYSLGVVAYEMFTGMLPNFQINSDGIKILEHKDKLPVSLIDFIEKLLTTDPNLRPNISQVLQHKIFSHLSGKF